MQHSLAHAASRRATADMTQAIQPPKAIHHANRLPYQPGVRGIRVFSPLRSPERLLVFQPVRNSSVEGSIANESPDGPTRRRPKSKGQPPTPATNPNEIYTVGYDATKWYHPDTTDKITLLDGTSVPIGEDAAMEGEIGHLGTCTSQHLAEKMGRSWLHGQLKSADPASQVAWKRQPWRKVADEGRWTYSIRDPSRETWLAVTVTRCVVLTRRLDLANSVSEADKSLGKIEVDGDVIDIFRISSEDTDTQKGVLRHREMEVTRAGDVGVARGQNVQSGYTIPSVLDEKDFDAAEVLSGMR